MTLEYRQPEPEEMRHRIWSGRVGFGDTTDETAIDISLERGWIKREWILAAFDHSVIASQVATAPMRIHWNGNTVGCGAVTAVSSLPTHRRRGHLRELMRRSFASMRDADQPVAMLWASMAAIYQRFGYGIGYTRHIAVDFDPRQVRFNDPLPVTGRTRLLRAEDAVAVIAPVWKQFAQQRTLSFDREPWWWERLLKPWRPEAPPYLVCVYEEGDQVLGYCVYNIEILREINRPTADQRLHIYDFVWNSPAAHRALIENALAYDLVFGVTIWRMPVDDPLFDAVQEPRLLNLRTSDGTLVRIVDLVAALEARGYDADGRFSFAIDDDLCPWNAGTWELTVEAGRARVKPTSAEPDLQLTPRTLAMIASGHRPATWLARNGAIPTADPKALCTADALFRTACAPFAPDGF